MRTASRTPVTLKIKFKSTTLEQFIERYSVDISHGGIFIRTKDPLPVGTNLRFEFQLKDASPLITGDGTVVWTRDFDPTRSGVAPGMGVRFDRLPSESQEVLEQILAHKTAKLGKPPEAGFLDTPTKVAFGNVPTKVTPKELLEGLAQAEARRTLLGVAPPNNSSLPPQPKSEDTTPLPPALPYHNELDEFPDEAFEEATKVAALEGLARRSAETEVVVEDGSGPLPPFGKSLDDDVTQQRRGRITPRGPVPEEIELRHPIRDTDPGPPTTVPPSSPSQTLPPIFHDLPARSPFAGNGANGRTARDTGEGRAARDTGEGRAARDTGEGRAARDTGEGRADADPFALPVERGGAGSARSARSLRVVEAAPLEPAPAPVDEVDADDDEDGEVTDQSVDVPPAMEPIPEPAAAAAESERDGSSMPWIAAAAIILLGGAIGGFLLLSGGKDEGEKAAVRSEQAPTSQKAAAPVEPPVAPPRAEPPAPAAAPLAGVDVTVVSEPAGATAELVGGSQSGPTPMTFRGLVAGQSYQVKIRKAGFLVADVAVKPEAGNPPAVELKAKPAVLHVTSDPSGAQIWINGRRQRSVTPADVELSNRTAERKRVTVSVRKSGYATAEQTVSLDKLSERGESMVQDVSMVLVRQVPDSSQTGSEDSAKTDETEAGDGSADKAPEGEASSPDKPAEGASEGEADKPKTEPESAPAQPSQGAGADEGDPIPDWMKPK
jgi:uncharacterized protein (TIGR02266 family)